MSRVMASIILRRFSACCSAFDSNLIWAILETPSTSSATSSLNASASCSLETPVSSITSCSMAAISEA